MPDIRLQNACKVIIQKKLGMYHSDVLNVTFIIKERKRVLYDSWIAEHPRRIA